MSDQKMPEGVDLRYTGKPRGNLRYRRTADDGPPQVWVCQGPPICELTGDTAVKAQNDECPWCTVITVYPDGTETTDAPGQA